MPSFVASSRRSPRRQRISCQSHDYYNASCSYKDRRVERNALYLSVEETPAPQKFARSPSHDWIFLLWRVTPQLDPALVNCVDDQRERQAADIRVERGI